MLRMAQLGEQHGGGNLGEGVAETEQGTTAHEHCNRSAHGVCKYRLKTTYCPGSGKRPVEQRRQP